jgi:hypothetical protein
LIRRDEVASLGFAIGEVYMGTINVDGLPQPVVDWLTAMVIDLKGQYAQSERLPPGEGLRRAAGAWADADEAEFNQWREETYKQRKLSRAEP